MRKGLTIEIISAILILLFTYTAISKLIEHKTFSIVLSEAPLFKTYAILISWLIPIAEIIIVLLLIFPSIRIVGLFGSLALVLLFTGYLIYIVTYVPKLPCNCGGVVSKLSWSDHIFFNIAILIINIVALKKSMSKKFTIV